MKDENNVAVQGQGYTGAGRVPNEGTVYVTPKPPLSETEKAIWNASGAALGQDIIVTIHRPYVTRAVYGHEINAVNTQISLSADNPSHGNASHYYEASKICGPLEAAQGDGVLGRIHFQDGPVAVSGINGITNEILLAIVADRLRGFQGSRHACRENALALTKIEEALHWLHHRTKNRESRGVEGTDKE